MSNPIRLFKNLLKFGIPAYLILLPAIMVFGWISPWPPAKSVLSERSDQMALLVGASCRNYYSLGAGHNVVSSRSYIFVPSALTDPKVVTLTQTNSADPTVSESRSGFFGLIALFVLSIAGTWWFWRRRGAT